MEECGGCRARAVGISGGIHQPQNNGYLLPPQLINKMKAMQALAASLNSLVHLVMGCWDVLHRPSAVIQMHSSCTCIQHIYLYL